MMRRLSLAMSLATVAWVPLVAGGNRPLIWGLAALWMGLAGVVCAAAPVTRSSRSLRSLLAPGLLFGVFLIWSAIQAASLPGMPGAYLSLSPADTLLSTMTMATCGLLFLVIAQTVRSARGPLVLLFVIAAAQAVWALISLRLLGDTLMGAEKVQYQGFATGTFVNRNSLADFVGCAIPIGVCLLALQLKEMVSEGLDGRRVFYSILLVLGMAFLLAALVASGSRMALFATAMATGICLLLIALRYRRELPAGWLLLGTGCLAAVFLVFFGTGLTDRTFDLVHDAAVRGELYRQVWPAILGSPWTGYGGGSFAVVFPSFQAPPLPGELIWSKAHSTYLALLFEYGIIGGMLPVIAVGIVLVQLLWSVVRSGGGYAQIAAVGVATMFAIHSLVDFGLEMQGNALMLAAVLGVAAGSLAAGRAQTSAAPAFTGAAATQDASRSAPRKTPMDELAE